MFVSTFDHYVTVLLFYWTTKIHCKLHIHSCSTERELHYQRFPRLMRSLWRLSPIDRVINWNFAAVGRCYKLPVFLLIYWTHAERHGNFLQKSVLHTGPGQ